MEDGLKLGIVAGLLIYLVRQQNKPDSSVPWTPPDIHYTTPVRPDNPATLPPPNVDGCIIPPTTEDQEAILKDAATCKWVVRTKVTPTTSTSGQDYTYDPYNDATSWVPVNPLEVYVENM